MRVRLFFVLAGLGGGVIAACSSGGGTPTTPVDAGMTGGAGLGETCNPSAAQPCVVVTDVCSVAVCDPASHLCVRVSVDAGPTCGGNAPPCASGECDGSTGDATTEAGDAAGGDGSTEGGAGVDSSIDGGGASDASDAADEAGA